MQLFTQQRESDLREAIRHEEACIRYYESILNPNTYHTWQMEAKAQLQKATDQLIKLVTDRAIARERIEAMTLTMASHNNELLTIVCERRQNANNDGKTREAKLPATKRPSNMPPEAVITGMCAAGMTRAAALALFGVVE